VLLKNIEMVLMYRMHVLKIIEIILFDDKHISTKNKTIESLLYSNSGNS
jgi:hypothetical protein